MGYADRLIRLFDYDMWGSLRILEALKNHSAFDRREQAVEMFSHILKAHRLWFQRVLREQTPDTELWPDQPDLESAASRVEQIRNNWKSLIGEHRDDLSVVIEYRNTRGEPFATRLDDILNHVIIHGQHHRAQIAKMLRYAGITPPSTDYIFYTREADHQIR